MVYYSQNYAGILGSVLMGARAEKTLQLDSVEKEGYGVVENTNEKPQH